MRLRLAWCSTAPLMFGGLLAAHSVGYRLAIADPHARRDALSHSGHAYFAFMPLALAVCAGVLLVALVYQCAAGFRGERNRAAASPLIVALPPIAFVVQEVFERLVHTGHVPLTLVLQPAFLIGLALQLPFALAALLVSWALDSTARAVGLALATKRALIFSVFRPLPVRVVRAPRAIGLERGYGERAPPLFRRA